MKISYNWLKEYVDIKLPADELARVLTMAGLAVESLQKMAGDQILELEVTANRPDWLSYIGVAREIAALTGKKLKIPIFAESRKPKAEIGIRIKVEDKKLCPRYTASIIRNVKVGESPVWLKSRIEAMGLRPVNNIVDITNFCLFETGEPMHAFDLDRIMGEEVIIRRAKTGERMTTIDNVNRLLDDSILVIADKMKPIAIAGLMGGLNTEVTFATKNILLEAAYFDPISIRRASRSLGISTESSYRFERKVDIENIVRFSDRACGLICEMTGGTAGGLVDVGDKKMPRGVVDLKYSRLNKLLGVEIAPVRAKKILNSLGLKTGSSSRDGIKLEPPSFRYDLNDEIDLIEEVSRVYGYDNIPSTIPDIVEQPKRLPPDMIIAKKIRSVLTGLGCDEAITYSLISKRELEMACVAADNVVEIKNPLTNEQEVMRTTLLIGMLKSVLWNINRKMKDLKLFELGNIYLKEPGDKFVEKRLLSIGMTGQAFSGWAGSSRNAGFFELKGMTEALFSELGVAAPSFKHDIDSRFSSEECAGMEIDGKRIGILGQANRRLLNNFDIKDKVYICELDVDFISESSNLKKTFKELPRYPSVTRDISIIVGKDVLSSDLVYSIKEMAGRILKETVLIDRYVGKQIPDGKVGLTYRLEYQDLTRTLEEKGVQELHARILRTLDEKFGAKLR